MRPRRHWYLTLVAVVAMACANNGASLAQPQGATQDLEHLVAPIALYPDPLIAQVLPASTKPLEVMDAASALASGTRPSESSASQWDPSIQALLSYPTVLKMMNDKIDWTTQLGQAFVANQGGVMASIQAVRAQAQNAGNLTSNSYQSVQTQGSTIVIEPANPQYIYVPQYNPVAILAPAPYYAYAPLMTFGVGFAAGAATAYACDWGHYGGGYGSVTVNNNYHYNYSNNYNAYHTGSSGSYSSYHPQSGTYSGYNARTGTYGAYNPETGKYGTYNPSTGAYNKNGQTGTYHPPSSSSSYGASHSNDSSGWGGSHSSWGGGSGSGGDAFHGMGGGGWGAQDASNRGGNSGGGRSFGGGGWGGGGGFGGGGFDRGGGGFGGGGGGFGGGGFRGGGFGGFHGGGRR